MRKHYCGAWGRGRHCREADPLQQALETRVISQPVHARIYMEIDKPVALFLVRLLQGFKRAVVLSQA